MARKKKEYPPIVPIPINSEQLKHYKKDLKKKIDYISAAFPQKKEKSISGKAKKSITRLGALPKNGTAGIIASMDHLMLNHTNEEWRSRFCNQIAEFGLRKESINIADFCVEYRIARRTMNNLINMYEDINQAWSDAKEFIACHRYNGAFKKEYDREVFFRDQHRYDPRWHKEVNVYHAELRNEENKNDLTNKEFVIIQAPPGKAKPKPMKEAFEQHGKE